MPAIVVVSYPSQEQLEYMCGNKEYNLIEKESTEYSDLCSVNNSSAVRLTFLTGHHGPWYSSEPALQEYLESLNLTVYKVER